MIKIWQSEIVIKPAKERLVILRPDFLFVSTKSDKHKLEEQIQTLIENTQEKYRQSELKDPQTEDENRSKRSKHILQ